MSEKTYLKLPINKALFYIVRYRNMIYELFEITKGNYDSHGYTFEDDYNEDPYLSKVHPIIRTLNYLDEVVGFTHEGGFAEVYSYEFGFGIWQCLEGLYEAGEYQLLTVLCFAIEYYEHLPDDQKDLSSSQRIAKIKQAGISQVDFGLPISISYADLTISSLSELDDAFDDLRDEAHRRMVALIRKNPNAFVVDENGLPFDETFTGICENLNADVGYILPMQNGKPHGKFQIFHPENENWVGEFEQGFLKCQSYISKESRRLYKYDYEPYNDYTAIVNFIRFYDGNIQPEEQTRKLKQKDTVKIGIQTRWYPDGTIKEICNHFDPLNHRVHYREWYYKNGQLKLKGLWDFIDIVYGEHYHENGQKSEELFYDSKGYEHITQWSPEGVVILYSAFDRYGKYLGHHSFYPNGAKKQIYIKYTEAQKPTVRFSQWRQEIRQAWDENGVQTVIDGTGFIHEKNYWGEPVTRKYQDGLLCQD